MRRAYYQHRLRLFLVGVILGLALAVHFLRQSTHLDPERKSWTVLSPSHELFSALLPQRAVTVAPGPGGRRDVYIAWLRKIPQNRCISVTGIRNVTRSPLSHEEILEVVPGGIAFAVRGTDTTSPITAIELVLFEQHRRTETIGQPSPTERLASALSSFESWGQFTEPRRLRLQLRETSSDARVHWTGQHLAVSLPQGELLLEVETATLTRGHDLAEVVEPPLAHTDLFRWTVDQARYSRWIGPDRLQQLEELYLDISDAFAGFTEHTGEALPPVALMAHLGRRASEVNAGDWPPEHLTPILTPALSGEGQWVERDELFITHVDETPPLLYTTFLRTEPERTRSSRVFVTVWDPNWLDLDWVAGTVEPRSTIGLSGTGKIPQRAITRLVAGFNGGFQAVDGAFGMKTKRGPFLPPVAYGATIARLASGRIGLGTWPQRQVDEERVIAYRQNLTALIERGQVNPWRRRFWGGVPATLTDTSRTDRTGLCLTTNHHLAYFWGQRVTVAGLARAMETASCDYGMLLDINFSNTVFETYRIAPRGELPALDRPLDSQWEQEGVVPGREDLEYRVQAMAPGMTRVGFPRYIHTELRDFFFLTIRPEALSAPSSSLCEFQPVADETGAPPRAWRCGRFGEKSVQTELFELDTRRVQFTLEPSSSGTEQWLAWQVSDQSITGGMTLRIDPTEDGGISVAILDTRPTKTARNTVLIPGFSLDGNADQLPPTAGLVVAVGSGNTLVLGGSLWPNCQSLAPHLYRAGFQQAMFIPQGEDWLVISPDPKPMAHRIFQETKLVNPGVWRPFHRQAQRRIDELGLTRHYVQIRHYLKRDRPDRR